MSFHSSEVPPASVTISFTDSGMTGGWATVRTSWLTGAIGCNSSATRVRCEMMVALMPDHESQACRPTTRFGAR